MCKKQGIHLWHCFCGSPQSASSKAGENPTDDFEISFLRMNLTHILLFSKCLLIKQEQTYFISSFKRDWAKIFWEHSKGCSNTSQEGGPMSMKICFLDLIFASQGLCGPLPKIFGEHNFGNIPDLVLYIYCGNLLFSLPDLVTFWSILK